MHSKKVQFQNSNGQTLSARLELPDKETVKHHAIFAHCFTCKKNLSAVRNISRSLNNYGIAVLRFDFTGLGESALVKQKNQRRKCLSFSNCYCI